MSVSVTQFDPGVATVLHDSRANDGHASALAFHLEESRAAQYSLSAVTNAQRDAWTPFHDAINFLHLLPSIEGNQALLQALSEPWAYRFQHPLSRQPPTLVPHTYSAPPPAVCPECSSPTTVSLKRSRPPKPRSRRTPRHRAN